MIKVVFLGYTAEQSFPSSFYVRYLIRFPVIFQPIKGELYLRPPNSVKIYKGIET